MSDYEAGQILGQWPVDIGGLRLDRVDEHSVEWSLTELRGWGSAAASGESTDRPGARGSWAPSRWERRAKDYTLTLAVDAETPAARWAAEQRLLGAIDGVDQLMVVHEEIPRQTTVRLNGAIDIVRTSVYTFDAEVPLLALDPLRYGLEPHEVTFARGGTVAIPNVGNTTAWPRIRLNGPLTNPKVQLSADVFMKIDATIPAGSWLLIDTDRRYVRMFDDPAGNLRGSWSGTWFGIKSGGAPVSLIADAGAGTATVTVPATWN